MNIHGYIMAFVDDVDVLPDALNSLARVCDRIYLIDGGLTQGSLSHHPRYTDPINDWLTTRPEFSGYGSPLLRLSDGDAKSIKEEDIQALKRALEGYRGGPTVIVRGDMALELSGVTWSGVPLVTYQNDFLDPGTQRNWITKKIEASDDQPDWYVWIDADEVLSDQFVNGVRGFLAEQHPAVTNVVPKWLNLIVDERHMAGGGHSDWLAHGRLYRPKTIYWQAGWHEHQYYEGQRVQFDVRVIHTRGLFRRRLLVQRGHPRVSGRDDPLWGDVQAPEPIPQGVTWPPLHWPEGEYAIPFEQDARQVWDAGG